MYNDKDIDRAVMLREVRLDIPASTKLLERVIRQAANSPANPMREANALEQATINYQLLAEYDGDKVSLMRLHELCQRGLDLCQPRHGRKVMPWDDKRRIFLYRQGLAYFVGGEYRLAHHSLQRAYNLSVKGSTQRAEFAGKLARVLPFMALEQSSILLNEAFKLNAPALGQDDPRNVWPQWNRNCGILIDMALAMSRLGMRKESGAALKQARRVAAQLRDRAGRPIRAAQVEEAAKMIKAM